VGGLTEFLITDCTVAILQPPGDLAYLVFAQNSWNIFEFVSLDDALLF